MKFLNLSHRGLTSLDGIDLSGVTILYCDNNKLTTLPTLPDELTVLECESNKLTSLPNLPQNLVRLWCCNNSLTSLPYLPDNLTELSCEENKLTSLPFLPDGLVDLWCYSNKLTTLSHIPGSLMTLSCFNNNLPLPLPNDVGKSINKDQLDEIKLIHHNIMRKDLGLPIVNKITNSKEIRGQWKIWQYRPDGEKYNIAKQCIEQN